MFEEEEESANKTELEKKASIQKTIFKYLEEEKSQKNDAFINEYFNNLKKQEKEFDIKEILHLLRSIIYNHHRSTDFFAKIEQIMINLKENIKQNYSNSQLFNFFSENKMMVLLLIENKMLQVDELVLTNITKPTNMNYFFPEIESYYANHPMKFEGENEENYKIYEKKRRLGENDSKICEMIRNDYVEEFISYVNRTNTSLNSIILKSHFETNLFLVEKIPTLIEYAAFFGSIQIFRYLVMNNVKLTNSLWLFAIHSNNAELIHLLEENNVEPIDKTYKECLIEAIKCHHNDIANYLFTNKDQKEFYLSDYLLYDNYERLISDSLFFSEHRLKLQYIYDLIKTYPKIVDLLIRESYLDVNFKIILPLLFISFIDGFSYYFYSNIFYAIVFLYIYLILFISLS